MGQEPAPVLRLLGLVGLEEALEEALVALVGQEPAPMLGQLGVARLTRLDLGNSSIALLGPVTQPIIIGVVRRIRP